MGGYVIVSEIGSQIAFIRDNLQIKKSDLLLKKPIPIFYMIVIWLEKVWLVDKSGRRSLRRRTHPGTSKAEFTPPPKTSYSSSTSRFRFRLF